MSNSDRVVAPNPRMMQVPWILGIALVAMGLYMTIGGYFIGGSYVGRSLQTPGTVVQLQDDKPVVAYVVNGTPFQHALNDHGPQFEVGQTVVLCFSEANPAGAQSCSDRTYSMYSAVTGIGLLAVGLALALWSYLRRYLVSRVIRLGNVVDAKILQARANTKVHLGQKVLWYISCAWDERGSGRPFTFVSQGVWATQDPSEKLLASGVETLPVFIDPLRPEQNYYVDTSAIDRVPG